ncbi:MAG: hypothetical protein CVT63_06065 [Candidatus Anoxymicrobium japonicum]|uniref:Uncharacterized protein n=1 Tax=Candidatus Anoxymicrobium japonicum TaxID=2013648 RepID=A0A2N3G516_9ACTN|nr:MAG: hypothetical protein CVT63_06065 [Candidatus Anoxymicrobium japonicum]
MRYCKDCGFPVPYGKFLAWSRNGTIIGKDSGHTRLVYLEVDELHALFSGVSRWRNASIDPIICKAEKEVGKRFIETLLPGFLTKLPRGKIARPEFGIKATSKFIFNYMAGLGMGRAELIEYASGNHARVLITNPHSVPLIAGDGLGVFEFLERIGVRVEWKRIKSNEYIITVQKVSDEPSAEKQLTLAETPFLPGSLELDKCPRCSVPLAVTASIYLDFEKGILRHTQTGMRFVALPTQSFHAVLKGLEQEFGPELPALMEGLEQKYMRETSAVRYAIPQGSNLINIMSDFPWMGIGNPISAWVDGRKVHFVVENPFHSGIVAGKITGLYEAWTGHIVRTGWTKELPGRVEVTLEHVT